MNRHVYQRSVGGKTYCPLEKEARIIITSTPLFAKQVSSKTAIPNSNGNIGYRHDLVFMSNKRY